MKIKRLLKMYVKALENNCERMYFLKTCKEEAR